MAQPVPIEPQHDVVLVDGRRWLACPHQPCGFRILVDAGQMALDAMDWHAQYVHGVSAPRCPCCGSVQN